MKSIPKIINEEIRGFLRENDEGWSAMYDAENNIKAEMFQDFLYNNNQDFTKNISWQLVPFNKLKYVWEEYIKMGTIRNPKALESIERTVIRNALKIDIITNLAGHTQWGDEESIEENIGYWVDEQINCILPEEPINTDQLEIPYDNPSAGYKQKEPVNVEPCETEIHPFAQKVVNERFQPENMDREDAKGFLRDAMKDQFFDYYLTDPHSGHMYISDYGLEPIMQLTSKLYLETEPAEKVVLIDKILNVAHQRSDLASWFVQGGSHALSNLSGYDVPDEESGGYDTKSAISGRYNMSDYR